MIILGIDPGIATLGYGVIEKDDRGNFHAVDYGVVVTPKDEGLPVRLAMLEEGINRVLRQYRPDEIAMEELFFSKNITTGIAVAHARGVALLTCVKDCGKLYEYTPMQVKQALTGYGRADKHQIQSVVTSMLHLKEIPRPDDAADALAIALCHGFSSQFGELFAVGNMTRAKGQNASPASAYQALMQEGMRKSKKKASDGFSSAQTVGQLQNATGLSGVTGVGRASGSTAAKKPRAVKPKTAADTLVKTGGTTQKQTASTVDLIAKSVVQPEKK